LFEIAADALAPLGDGIRVNRTRLGHESLLFWWRGRLSMAVTREAN
jgi:hypothetical protein